MKRLGRVGVLAALAASSLLLTACSSARHPVSDARPPDTGELNSGVSFGSAGASSTVTDPDSASSAPDQTSPPSGVPPTSHYIAVCNGTQIDYFNPSDGAALYQQTTVSLINLYQQPGAAGPGGDTGSFSATGSKAPSGLTSFDCSNYSYDGTLSHVAGLDSYAGGDTVPATLDLASGTVTDLVRPTDHSGFTSTPPVIYLTAAYNPRTEVVWYLKQVDDTHLKLSSSRGGPSTTFTVDLDGPPPVYGIGFIGNSPTPIVYGDAGSGLVQLGTQNIIDYADFGYLPDSAVPETDYKVQAIRSPDSGKPGGAFLAYSPDGSSNPGLYTIASSGAQPKQLAVVQLADTDAYADPQVIRFMDK